jgi:hypothetical protein
MKIVWDLDGVLRDLSGYVAKLRGCPYPKTWNADYGGKDIYECIDENLNILVDAPPTAYLKIMKKHFSNPEIWTSQKDSWKQPTMDWIREHVGKDFDVHFLRCEEKEAKLAKKEDVLLVEDTPNFKSYDRVLLIDRPYNQGVVGAVRIFGTKHLNNMVELSKDM